MFQWGHCSRCSIHYPIDRVQKRRLARTVRRTSSIHYPIDRVQKREAAVIGGCYCSIHYPIDRVQKHSTLRMMSDECSIHYPIDRVQKHKLPCCGVVKLFDSLPNRQGSETANVSWPSIIWFDSLPNRQGSETKCKRRESRRKVRFTTQSTGFRNWSALRR